MELHSPRPCNIHLLAHDHPGEYYEYGLIHPFFDWVTPPYLNSPCDPLDDEGYIHVPQGDGFGWDINYDYIKEHLVVRKQA
jgi:L-alanine-DL-glutamate epimerase-like enolase superfamily enzyme